MVHQFYSFWGARLILLSLVIFSKFLFAQDRVGNGGGTWVCRDKSRNIVWVEFQDLFEAREEFRLTLRENLGKDEEGFSRPIAARFADIFKPIFGNSFVSDVLSSYANINYLKESEKVVLTNELLSSTGDSLHRISPQGFQCPNGTIALEQFINFKFDGSLLVQQEIYQASSVRDRVAASFHEAIYEVLRKEYKENNSVKTRRIVGLLFSTLEKKEVVIELEKIHKTLSAQLSKNLIEGYPARFSSRDRFSASIERAMSVYYNPKTKVVAASWRQTSQSAADLEAKEICGSDCVNIFSENTYECAALYHLNGQLCRVEKDLERSWAEKFAYYECSHVRKTSKDWDSEPELIFSICPDE